MMMDNKLYHLFQSYFDLNQDSFSNVGFGYCRNIFNDFNSIIRQRILNALLLKEMSVLTNLFHENAVPHVFLKGPLLGHLLYTHDGFLPAMRQTGDIDILIPFSFMPVAFNLLGKYGYQYGGKYISEEDCNNYINSNQNGVFHSVHFPDLTRQNITIDLHFTSHKVSPEIPTTDYQSIAEEQCNRARSVNVDGIKYPYLCTEDLLLSLCSHFAKHILTAIQYVACESQDTSYPMPLMKLIDIDLLLSQNKSDIEHSLPVIIQAAKRQHCLYPFAFCISLIYKTTNEYEMIYSRLQEECRTWTSEDVEDDMLAYCMQHYTLEDYLQRTANELLYSLRCYFEPKKIYHIKGNETQSDTVIVHSKLYAEKHFEWKAYYSEGSYTFIWAFPKKLLSSPAATYEKWMIQAKVESNEDLSLGIVLSSGRCQSAKKHCAFHYAFPVSESSELSLYRIYGLNEPYEEVDRISYSFKKTESKEMLSIALTLEEHLLPKGFTGNTRYFDIYSIFPKTDFEPAIYLSWNREKIYHSINCMHCGKLQ